LPWLKVRLAFICPLLSGSDSERCVWVPISGFHERAVADLRLTFGRRGDLDLEVAAFEATLAGFCLFGLPPAPSLPEAFCLVEAFVPAAEIVDFFFRPDVFCLELLAEGFLSPEAAPISAPDTAPVKAPVIARLKNPPALSFARLAVPTTDFRAAVADPAFFFAILAILVLTVSYAKLLSRAQFIIALISDTQRSDNRQSRNSQ